MIGYYTGLGISKAFALTWDDIDLEKNTSVDNITVKRNFGVDVPPTLNQKGKQEECSSWYFSSPKTYSSKRKVKFGETLYQAFLYAHNQVKANEEKYGEYYTDIFLKLQKDEKGNDMFKLIEISREIPCSLPKARMLCVRENGQYISTDSFKYASRVIHYELKIHSIIIPYVTFASLCTFTYVS